MHDFDHSIRCIELAMQLLDEQDKKWDRFTNRLRTLKGNK